MPQPNTDLTATNSFLWWLSAKKDDNDPNGKELAQNLTRTAQQQEILDIPRRFRNLTYYRHFTGRPAVGTYAFGMARRPATFLSYYGQTEFYPPRYNIIGACADIYVNRLLSHKIYVTMLPDDSVFEQRQVAKDIENWIEAGFVETGFWEQFKAMGIDALCYGSGFLKWFETYDKQIGCMAVAPDELLFPNYDDPNPYTVIQRVWANKEDVYDRYGKDDKEAAKAILKAPNAFPAFFFGPGVLNTDSIIPLLEGWRLPHSDGKPGRHVLVVGDYTIVDEPYTDTELPFIRYDFNQLPSSLFGQGISELLLSINEETDRLLAVIQESDIRSGQGKWIAADNANVNPDALGDINGALVTHAAGTDPPKFEAFEPIGEYALQHLDKLIELAMNRVHISANAISGQLPKELSSAVALERYSQIDDTNFLEKTVRAEDVVLKSAYAMIRLGKKLKPSYTLPGRNGRQIIDWKKLKIDGKTPVGLHAYSTGRLGQTVAGMLQQLDSMLANGSITRELYNKYLQVPNTDDLLDQINAPVEGVDRALDILVLSNAYIPPVEFFDLDYAKQASERRYIIEQGRNTPVEQLQNLLQWRAAILELRQQQQTPDAPPAPEAGFSGTQLPNAAPGLPVGTGHDIPGKPVALPSATAPQAPAAPQVPLAA